MKKLNLVAVAFLGGFMTGYELCWMQSSLYSLRTQTTNTSPAKLNETSTSKTIHAIEESVCSAATHKASAEWALLCSRGFVTRAAQLLLQKHQHVHMVQIGAHVGFEGNDPMAKGIVSFLKAVSNASAPKDDVTQKFHWTFVEPSPPNFLRLVENLEVRKNLCDLKSINVGVVPDSANNTDTMVFYSIRDTIDPETGFDSKSGKTLPNWITQVSGFSMAPINFNRRIFLKQGLRMKDYVVETNVTVKRYSELMEEAIEGNQKPFFLMIDTEGFDCDIIKGISPKSNYLPEFILFETHCPEAEALSHLENMGYETHKMADGHNAMAFQKKSYALVRRSL